MQLLHAASSDHTFDQFKLFWSPWTRSCNSFFCQSISVRSYSHVEKGKLPPSVHIKGAVYCHPNVTNLPRTATLIYYLKSWRKLDAGWKFHLEWSKPHCEIKDPCWACLSECRLCRVAFSAFIKLEFGAENIKCKNFRC